jgi:hypothetical protein
VIESIISSLVVIIGVLLGDYLSSLVFSSVKDVKGIMFEILLFLVLLNIFLFNILIVDVFIVQLFVYFLVSFVSIIASRAVVFLLFNRVLKRFSFKRNHFNSNAVKLAKLLNKKFTKKDLIRLFRKAGFSSGFAEHLNRTLKE